MSLRQAEIAAVVNLHREGAAAIPSLVSAWRAAEHARASGVSVQLAIVLDTPDAETVAIANAWSKRGARIIPIEVGDLGAARNAAVRALDSEWMAFLDGDDLWGESWLTRAFTAANAVTDPTPLDVWHPQVNVMFGGSQSLLHHLDSEADFFSLARLRLHNAWTALSFVRRTDLESVPYPRNRIAEGFGYEDWSWNIEVLRRGGRHRVVHDSLHAIYRAPANATSPGTNLLTQSLKALRSPYPKPAAISASLPGRTTAVSELTQTDPDLPPQYEHASVQLYREMMTDLWKASSITAELKEVIERLEGEDSSIPLNMNIHVTEAQRALEELDLSFETRPDRPFGELLEDVTLIHGLPAEEQHRVVAEVLLNPIGNRGSVGESPLIDSTVAAYPQLREQL